MRLDPDTDTLIQVNFPQCAAGRLSELYYTIYNSDGTIYQARTQTGTVALGDGSYGVILNFADEANYSIFWDINDKELVASEELNVQYVSEDLSVERPVVKFTI